MIVTFQVAIYLAYQLWQNYISIYFGNTEDPNHNDVEHLNTDSTLNSDLDSHVPNSSEPDEPSREDSNRTNEPNITLEPKAEDSYLLENNGRSQQKEEGDGNCHPCLYSDDTYEGCVIENKKPIDATFACHYIEGKEIRFIPPAYTQRYMVIEDVLKEERWSDVKKVIDFGCSELSFEVTYLKKLVHVQEIVAVDINLDELDYYKCKLVPNAIDYIDRRPTPLTVKIYCGSVGHTNKVLEGAEAVIAIELIEHLYPPDLDSLPFTVFGFIRPKIAMFTTPNADFNVLFPNFSGFRHWDHKFEWSRQQFEDWGNNIVKRYPEYSVSFRGVTSAPPGLDHLGCLSQMATFIKNDSSPPLDEEEVHFQEGPYNLVQETSFPFHEDKRTPNEIIRDDAVTFIKKCAMLSHYSDVYPDDGERKEIPLKNIMERIQFFNRKKLIDILAKEKYETVKNADGYEVIILPESEDENYEEDLCDDCYFDPVEKVLTNNCETSMFIADENWDIEWSNEPAAMTENLSVSFLQAEHAFNEQNYISNTNSTISMKSKENHTNIKPENDCKESHVRHDQPLSNPDSDENLHTVQNLSGSHNRSGSDMSLEYNQLENVIVDDSLDHGPCNNLSSDSLAPHSLERFCPNENNKINEGAEIECSVYETPFNDWLRSSSKYELNNPSAQSLYYNKHSPYGDCKRELDFETPPEVKENQPVTDSMDENLLCTTSAVSSPLESSYYATPCCSEIRKTRISKCLSLQDINDSSDSPLFVCEVGECLASNVKEEKRDNISKSMEGFRSQESCDIHETCSNTSRVIDSGYPGSFSDHNMDLDSIQFDDIETESEGEDLSSSIPSPDEPLEPPLPQRLVQNVENGDVVNNNRDGEGNNMVADMEEEVFEFEAQIEVDVPNNDVALSRDCSQNNRLGENLTHASCLSPDINGSVHNSQDYSPPYINSEDETLKTSDPLKALSHVGELDHGDKNETGDLESIKSVTSDTSFSTKNLWSNLKSSGSMSDIKQEVRQDHAKIGGHNSLTTVLEGCSRFSDCSIVCPINTSAQNVKSGNTSSANNEDGSDASVFPKWMLNIDCSVFQAEAITTNYSYGSFKMLRPNPSQGQLSSSSFYQSLSSTPVESDGEEITFDFPKWLLEIQVSDTEESNVAVVNSDFSMWDDESDETLGFNVQVDARGGGDPQRDSWFD